MDEDADVCGDGMWAVVVAVVVVTVVGGSGVYASKSGLMFVMVRFM